MRVIVLILAVLLFAPTAHAQDSPVFPSDSTLTLEKNIRPDPLKIEVDPNYRYHAEASIQRIKRAIWYLLRAHDELRLANNHRRTIDLPPLLLTVKQLDRLILSLEDALHPRRNQTPHANVLTHMPEASITVDPQTRGIVTSTPPRRPLDGIERLYDGLDAPSKRLPQVQPRQAPVVGTAPTKPAPTLPSKGAVDIPAQPKANAKPPAPANSGTSFLIPGISPVPIPQGPNSCPTGNCSQIPLPEIQAK